MKDDECNRREGAGRCSCGVQTKNIYKINGKPFVMPLTVDGEVHNGVCLACTASSQLKDPPEENNHNNLELLTKEATSPAQAHDGSLKKLPPPKFKSDCAALEWFKQQQTEKPPPKEDDIVVSNQTAKPVQAESNENGSKVDEQQHHVLPPPKSSQTRIGRPTTSPRKLKVRVVTSANIEQTALPHITLDLDPSTPPKTKSNNKQPTSSRFQTLDDAKQFIKQKTEQQNNKHKSNQSSTRTAKRLKQQQQSTRTSKRSRPQQPTEGTQMEFHRIMKINNARSKEMQHSMFVAAVLSAKNNKLSGSNEKFLASNGKLYPDLRGNFGKYSNMKQCAVCKQRVQGAYYCRLNHKHLEVPDYDGGNSAECLKELFRKNVEELERIQRFYLGDYEDELMPSTETASHGKDWSLDQLNDDLLCHIASYIPTLQSLASFSATSKRARLMLANSAHSERLFRGVYVTNFGDKETQGNYDINLSWKDRWAMIYNLKKALRFPSKLDTESNDNLRSTIGVLSERDEQDAIFYDNPQYGDPERDLCNGYFGMHMLHLPPPPNATENWQPPIVLHGDFNGIRIFNSLQDAICNPVDGEIRESPRFISLGDDQYGGQVLSIIHCDGFTTGTPTCFIGYASGRVAAVRATLSEDNRQYNFTIPTQEQAHEQEVTCFTFAKIGKNTTLLFSACCGGAIRFYPNALKSNGSFNLESTLAFNNFYGCGVFSLTSTVLKSPENITFNILCTGDRDGKVRLWSVGDDVSSAKNFRHLGQYNSSTQIGAGLHLVTKAKFINDSMLVTGTNQGSIRFWCLECKSNPARSIGKGPLPKLDLRYDLMGQHSGSVEVCTNVGDILLTSGGDDGKIIGWDINTGMKIGPAFRCHPGKRLTRLDDGEEVVVNSSVIDFVLNAVDGKLISLCRDGVLSEWRFGSSLKTAS